MAKKNKTKETDWHLMLPTLLNMCFSCMNICCNPLRGLKPKVRKFGYFCDQKAKRSTSPCYFLYAVCNFVTYNCLVPTKSLHKTHLVGGTWYKQMHPSKGSLQWAVSLLQTSME